MQVDTRLASIYSGGVLKQYVEEGYVSITK